jgi:hypothetical protein
MSVEQKIIDNSIEPIKGLAPRAAKAMKAPDTGVKILIPGAANVIRDCATVTTLYLPMRLYGAFKDPVEILKTKITRAEVEALVTRGTSNPESRQLSILMYADASKKLLSSKQPVNSPSPVPAPVVKPIDDIYGDYDNYTAAPEPEPQPKLDMNVNEASMIDVICEAFQAK